MIAGETRSSRGFTLLEVVIAVLLLEVSVAGAFGVLALASTTLGRAERLERAAALAEGVLDSLTWAPAPTDGVAAFRGGAVTWSVGAGGEVTLVALGPAGDTLFGVASILLPPGRALAGPP